MKVAIVGWNGYSGIELIKLALAHPQMQLAAVFARQTELTPNHFLPAAPNIPLYSVEKLSEMAGDFDTVFFATPIEASKEWIAKISHQSVNIIDLSGAFRLGHEDFSYGLQPFNQEISTKVANPGCYVTSVLMALIPLLKNGLIAPDSIVIDAKSGTTGAGRSSKSELSFTEVSDNCLPYKVGEHQHLPEITHYLQAYTGTPTDPTFTTHLMPFKRGILSSIYAKTSATEEDCQEVFQSTYKDYPLVKTQILDIDNQLLKLEKVVGSARTHISFKIVDKKLFLFSCIDNLMKGAASQAIENWNVQNGLSPQTFLENLQ